MFNTQSFIRRRSAAPLDPVDRILDREHENILQKYESLREGIIGGIGMTGIIARSKELIQVTLMHFRSEESAMDSHPVRSFSAHKRLHAQMTDNLNAISEDLEERRISGAMDLMKFFEERLKHHLEVEDAELEHALR